MEFLVPRGESAVCHIKVQPELPKMNRNGKLKAAKWKMSTVINGVEVEVEDLNIWFSKNSTKQQRQSERMIVVFSIDEDAQTKDESWRFTHGGLMYCKGKGDYLNNMDFEMSDDGIVLTGSVKCLTDIKEDFNFSFLAMRKDNDSGVCDIYASSDPGGSNGRK